MTSLESTRAAWPLRRERAPIPSLERVSGKRFQRIADPPVDTGVGQDLGAQQDVTEILAEREIDTRGRSVRQHVARGVVINSAFKAGLAGLGLLRRLLVAGFLTQAEFGIWGILIATLITLSWLKQIGIADKYIQQTEADQEAAYQKAFTLELMVSVAFLVLIAAVLPLYALAYGHPEIILPGIVLATSIPISSFQNPIWIAQRRMQFVRQRVLAAIDPVVALAVTVVLGVLGFGYWSLVIGGVAGSAAGALPATLTSPYSLRLRFERGTLGEYTRFSGPLLGLAISNLIVVQGSLLIANHTAGLAAVGVIGLASAISSFADRVNGLVNQTIYPAVCAVARRTELLREAFVKSNRISLMWAIPFGAGLALFAGDLVTFLLGERWRSATDLLAAMGLIIGLSQVAFNWSIFMRAVNNTKPLFQASLFRLGSFAAITAPALLALGLTGYAIGLASAVSVQLVVRSYFLRRMFAGFSLTRHLVRAVGPVVPAAAAVLLVRLAVGPERTLAMALGELALYVLLAIAFTLLFERRLVRELSGYLRRSFGEADYSFEGSGQPSPGASRG